MHEDTLRFVLCFDGYKVANDREEPAWSGSKDFIET